MSRIGKQPVPIPEKVKIDIKGTTVLVEGPKGKVQKTFAAVVKIEKKDNTVVVSPTDESRFSRAMFGTARSVIAGMVKGASEGYSKVVSDGDTIFTLIGFTGLYFVLGLLFLFLIGREIGKGPVEESAIGHNGLGGAALL